MKYIILLDYDGTLTEIVKKPSLAKLTSARRYFLKQLARHKKIIIGIVSGRSLKDVKSKVKVPGIYYIGNHGFEMEGPKLKRLHPKAKKFKPLLKKIARQLNCQLKQIKGIMVEDKGLTLSVHYRLAKKTAEKNARQILFKVLQKYLRAKQVKLTFGKKVFEIRPPLSWHKGKAVTWILKSLKIGKAIPFYFGDDETDEDAFRALKKKGITIRVGKRRGTAAQYLFKNVDQVYNFLYFIEKVIEFSPGYAKINQILKNEVS